MFISAKTMLIQYIVDVEKDVDMKSLSQKEVITIMSQKNDSISRKAAIDALLEEVRLVDGYYVENDEVINKDDAIEAIRLLPSAQPEIIYCKDCKYCSYDSIFDQSWCNYTSGVRKVKPTDFCSCGKRRINEGSD